MNITSTTVLRRRQLVHFRAPVVSGVSQLVGLIQIVLLTRGGAAGLATDTYFFLFNLSLLPVQILLAGLLYPTLLNQTLGHSRSRLIHWVRLGTPFLCVVAVALGAGWLWHLNKFPSDLYFLMALCALNGFISAHIWYHCLEIAIEGRALWLAGVALPANLIACLAIAKAWDPASLRATLMVAGLVLGNVMLLSYMTLTGRTRHPEADHLAAPTRSHTLGSIWFLAKSITGYASLNIVQALALLLPAASLTLVSVMTRIVGSFSTTVISSMLPRFVNRYSDSQTAVKRFLRWMTGVLLVPFVVVALLGLAAHIPYAPYPTLVAAWILASSMNVAAQRMAYRFLAPSASVLSIASAIVVILFLCIVATTSWFTLHVLLLGSLALDAIPASCLLWTLRERLMGGIPAVVFLITCMIVLGT
jgi:hypothetical protein